jgi:hypothetical protein
VKYWFVIVFFVYLYCATLDSNVDEFEGEEGFEEFGEVQGQTSQPRQAIS